MAIMDPLFSIQPDLRRVIDRGHAFALGVAGGVTRPPAWGWHRTSRPRDDGHPATRTWTVIVSHELLRPLLLDLFTLLPTQVTGILELGSRDAFRAIDVFLSRAPVPVERFRGTWDCFEALLLEDASLAVGVNGDGPFIEVFLDQDKRLIVHGEPATGPAVESVLRRFGLQERAENEILVPDSVLDATQTRPILTVAPNLIVDTDQLLMELRAAWDLELDDDPDRNLDMQGRDIGRTLWQGIVLLDQDDVAGRRQAHGHCWGVAASRREMETLLVGHIETEGHWELLDIISLDRAAFDDRPEALNNLKPSLPQRGVLDWRVETLGTINEWDGEQWGDDERF